METCHDNFDWAISMFDLLTAQEQQFTTMYTFFWFNKTIPTLLVKDIKTASQSKHFMSNGICL